MKPFHDTTTFKVLFWTGMIILFVLSFSIDLSAKPKPYKGMAKQERIYRQRKTSNQAEQYRIQSSGIKKYNKNNSWQKGRR